MPADDTLPPVPAMRRINYFTGRLLTAQDLQAEQEYHRDRLRRHNLALHAAGTAQGLSVKLSGAVVRVTPGLAVDCLGREICVPSPTEISLSGAAGRIVYLVISYAEQAIGLIPVPGAPDLSSEEAGALPGYIAETYALSFGLATKRHARRAAGWIGCREDHPLPLARLLRNQGRWRIDVRYRRPAAG